MVRISAPIALLLTTLTACTGTIAAGGDEPSGRPLGEATAACSVDRPHPRRALRLSPTELVAAIRTIAPLADADLPDGFVSTPIGTLSVRRTAGRPDDTLVVSRAFHEDLDRIARVAAGKIDAGTCALGSDPICTRTFVASLAARLHAAAADDEETTSIASLSTAAFARGGVPAAREIIVRALILSPRTIYATEGLVAAAPRLQAGEIASFLSLRITGAPPSEALVAALSQLAEPTREDLSAILHTHFRPEDLDAAAAHFLAVTLAIPDLGQKVRDQVKHPQATPAFLRSLQVEAHEAIDRFLAGPRVDLETFLTAPQSSSIAGDAENAAATTIGRPGLLTLPAVLSSISGVDHTNVPRRGRFLLQTLFCESVPTPPADAVSMAPPFTTVPSERVRFERIEQEPACRGCHVRVNHLGFGLERWNELGVARPVDEHGHAIDTASTHAVPGAEPLVFGDARELFARASKRPEVERCFATHAFRHFARRRERSDGDACLIDALAARARARGMALRPLFEDVLIESALAPRG